MSVKYPDIEVQLTGVDGNAYVIVGTVGRAMRKAKVADAEINAFMTEAKSGDYDKLLQTCCKWVTVS